MPKNTQCCLDLQKWKKMKKWNCKQSPKSIVIFSECSYHLSKYKDNMIKTCQEFACDATGIWKIIFFSTAKMDTTVFYFTCCKWAVEFHWVTHICIFVLVGISSCYGLSPVRRQAAIWTNTDFLSTGLLRNSFHESVIEFPIFSSKIFALKIWAISSRPYCNVLIYELYALSL